jgi:hypothetical protein
LGILAGNNIGQSARRLIYHAARHYDQRDLLAGSLKRLSLVLLGQAQERKAVPDRYSANPLLVSRRRRDLPSSVRAKPRILRTPTDLLAGVADQRRRMARCALRSALCASDAVRRIAALHAHGSNPADGAAAANERQSAHADDAAHGRESANGGNPADRRGRAGDTEYAAASARRAVAQYGAAAATT